MPLDGEEPLTRKQEAEKRFVVLHPVPERLLRNLGRAQTLDMGEPVGSRSLIEVPLTPSEIEVVRWASVGLNDMMIADETGRSIYTIKSQMKSAMRKLRAKNRGHAACKAIRQGIIR